MSVGSSPASAIEAAAVRVSARFFGFAPDSAAPSNVALGGVTESTVDIHFGISGDWPAFGRLRHCLAAMMRNRIPTATLNHSMPVSVSDSTLLPRARTTTALTAARPMTQPTANIGPAVRALGVPKTRTTAMIGIGLRATAIAEGSRSPMAWPNIRADSAARVARVEPLPWGTPIHYGGCRGGKKPLGEGVGRSYRGPSASALWNVSGLQPALLEPKARAQPMEPGMAEGGNLRLLLRIAILLLCVRRLPYCS